MAIALIAYNENEIHFHLELPWIDNMLQRRIDDHAPPSRESMREAMQNPQVTDVFVKAASPPAYMDQPDFEKFVDADAKRLIPVIRKIGRLDEK